MKWADVNHTHHGLTAEVSYSGRLPNGAMLDGPVMGRIRCEARGVIACLVDGDEKVHMFADFYDVDIID
jgi:hypothetical protein